MSKKMTVREYIKLRFAELERFADDWEKNQDDHGEDDWPLYLDAADWIQQEDAYNECAREQP
ncbi:hypothetical protein [Pseudomonas aeruginosa]|uniref:hypothetical protein n=1 Tax=Pseudomonas aeruginosa TaxID=287 RepID=UPI0024BE92CC|nr:hypothetical protein [Pseudomonas aeruginosa]MDJ1357026.1 hypothetical protein [Pseudomonas aeruginosa]HCF1405886.1 hypothetical protein [Pseudomonas aeruginosa]